MYLSHNEHSLAACDSYPASRTIPFTTKVDHKRKSQPIKIQSFKAQTQVLHLLYKSHTKGSERTAEEMNDFKSQNISDFVENFWQ